MQTQTQEHQRGNVFPISVTYQHVCVRLVLSRTRLGGPRPLESSACEGQV